MIIHLELSKKKNHVIIPNQTETYQGLFEFVTGCLRAIQYISPTFMLLSDNIIEKVFADLVAEEYLERPAVYIYRK